MLIIACFNKISNQSNCIYTLPQNMFEYPVHLLLQHKVQSLNQAIQPAYICANPQPVQPSSHLLELLTAVYPSLLPWRCGKFNGTSPKHEQSILFDSVLPKHPFLLICYGSYLTFTLGEVSYWCVGHCAHGNIRWMWSLWRVVQKEFTGVEKIGGVLIWPPSSKLTKYLIFPCIIGLLYDSPDFHQQIFCWLPP